jgi:hypothetical protein
VNAHIVTGAEEWPVVERRATAICEVETGDGMNRAINTGTDPGSTEGLYRMAFLPRCQNGKAQ